MSSVPLGTPLMDTVVEARDEHGVVTEGEGQVFIGRQESRVADMFKLSEVSLNSRCRWSRQSLSVG